MEHEHMSAGEALLAAHAAGVEVVADGDNLLLDADAPPSEVILDALRRHKSEIVTLLRPKPDDWMKDDWQAFFGERAGVAEFDGGLSRTDAEAQAFMCCVLEWLNHNPEPFNTDHCAWCGRPTESSGGVDVFGPDRSPHMSLHPECWDQWHRNRLRRAERALENLGLRRCVE